MNLPRETAVGLIGFGQAGMSLAKALLPHFELIGFDLDAARCQTAHETGIKVTASVAEVTRGAGIILLSLPTPEASHAVVAQMPADALPGKLVIETSTVAPGDIDLLGATLSAHGASVVDSAVVGGIQKLAQGETTFLVGAEPDHYERARPVLEAAAETIFHLGPPGSGMRAKLINNAIAHTTMVMLLEGAAMAVKAGIPLETYLELMRRESGLTRPLTHRLCERVVQQDFEGGMNTFNARKDSALILDLARSLKVPLFTIQASHSAYEVALGEGLGDLDYAAISKLWERWLGISFAGQDC